MILDLDKAYSAALAGIPRVLDQIATVPKAKRSLAWSAAQQSYLQAAQAVGYDENDARKWASTVRCLLEIAFIARERATF